MLEILCSAVQIDDVNTLALHENVLAHFGIPFAAHVTEVNTCFQQILINRLSDGGCGYARVE